jgi:adenosylcobinamide kinase/adenosylcobinamide-phosphate guanylyltransferase
MLTGMSLVLGGAASGKSEFAEALALGGGVPALYWATAEAGDAEMHDKIARHRARRGRDWRTFEAPLDAGAAVDAAAGTRVLLMDCATLWLGNAMAEGGDPEPKLRGLIATLAAAPLPVVVVSNELGMGLVPETPLGRAFREAHGRMNQALTARAERVVFVAAGLPLVLKGTLP